MSLPESPAPSAGAAQLIAAGGIEICPRTWVNWRSTTTRCYDVLWMDICPSFCPTMIRSHTGLAQHLATAKRGHLFDILPETFSFWTYLNHLNSCCFHRCVLTRILAGICCNIFVPNQSVDMCWSNHLRLFPTHIRTLDWHDWTRIEQSRKKWGKAEERCFHSFLLLASPRCCGGTRQPPSRQA